MASSKTACSIRGYTFQKSQASRQETRRGSDVSTSYSPCLQVYSRLHGSAYERSSEGPRFRPFHRHRLHTIVASRPKQVVPQGFSRTSKACEDDSLSNQGATVNIEQSGEEECKGSKEVCTTKRGVAKVLAFVASTLLALQGPQMAVAGIQKVGEFTGSGFIFKDSIEVMSIDDPKVEGVTIYVSDFQRSLTDRLAKDFFNEPSQASISCAQTSPVKITGKLAVKDGEEIFSETKNFLAFKTLHVRRIFDEKRNALVYVAYSTRFQNDKDKVSAGRYRTSICTVPLFNAVLEPDGRNGAV